MEQDTVKIDPLKLLYMETKRKILSDEELIENDLTEYFYKWKTSKLKRRELINITIRGEVATGKSTVGLNEMWQTLQELMKITKAKKVNPYERIFSDQTEFLRFIQSKQENTAVIIDEFNRMAETGLNATTETHLFDYYSDVFAQKRIHRYNCAPYHIMDKNSQVILDVLTPQREKKITTCKLMYREPTERQMLFFRSSSRRCK